MMNASMHYLDRIYGASKRLQRLVQDLLFVSKVEGGNLPLSRAQDAAWGSARASGQVKSSRSTVGR